MAKPSNLQTIPIADLTVDPANLRLHDERNASGIESSLKRFGPGRSVVVDGKGIIRAGNGTVEAARRAGFTEVLVVDPQPGQLVAVRREDWSPTEATAYAIVDNRLTDQSTFDQTGLAETLRALQSEAFDLDAVGFTADEVDELCDGLGADLFDDEEESEPEIDRAEELQEKWQTALGQLWAIPSKTTPGKEHRLLCGDSANAENVVRVMDGQKAGICLTDPPYGIGIAANPVRQKHTPSNWDNKAADNQLIQMCLSSAPAVIIWGGNYFGLPASQGFFVWDKKQPEEFSLAMCEMAWTNIQAPAKMYRESVTSYHKEHPTQKPVGLLRWCLEKGEGLVFDPFLGSGSTLVAAEQIGRLCYGLELVPRYVAVILDRLTSIGLEPKLA